MQTTRRNFLAQSAAAAGTTLLLTPFGASAERFRAASTRVSLGLTHSDRDVIAFASRFGRTPLLTGGGVLTRLDSAAPSPLVQSPLAVRVSIESLDSVRLAFGALPFADTYAEGNTLHFSHRGGSYELESLDSETFRTVELDFRGGRGGDLAHDSIAWDASSRHLSDPHGVISSNGFRLSRVSAPTDSMDQVRQWVRGWVDAANYGLEPDAEFRGFHQQVRSSTVRDEASALAVAGILISGLAELQAGAPAATVTAFLGSSLAKACVPVVTGEEVSAAIARHQSLESSLRSNGGSGWLAAVLGSGRVNQDTIRNLGLGASGLAASFRTRVAIREARTILAATPGLPK